MRVISGSAKGRKLKPVPGNTIHPITDRIKEAAELSTNSLQSLDNLEATYWEKGGESHHGYAVNLTKTCDPENSVQLITEVHVAPQCHGRQRAAWQNVARSESLHWVETLITEG